MTRSCIIDASDVAVTLRNMHPDFADSEKLTPLERAGNSSVSVATTTASVSATRAPSVSSTTSMAQPLRRVSSGAKFQFWYIGEGFIVHADLRLRWQAGPRT